MCQILGFNPITIMPPNFMYMAIQIQHPNFTVIFNFAPYLEENIHEGLQDVKNGVFSTHFYWYSLLIHMFLYRNVNYFEGNMNL